MPRRDSHPTVSGTRCESAEAPARSHWLTASRDPSLRDRTAARGSPSSAARDAILRCDAHKAALELTPRELLEGHRPAASARGLREPPGGAWTVAKAKLKVSVPIRPESRPDTDQRTRGVRRAVATVGRLNLQSVAPAAAMEHEDGSRGPAAWSNRHGWRAALGSGLYGGRVSTTAPRKSADSEGGEYGDTSGRLHLLRRASNLLRICWMCV